MIYVACVWTGNKYGLHYVERLQRMVRRHLPIEHEFVVLTDNDLDQARQDGRLANDVQGYELPGWWAKMTLFVGAWRRETRVIYLDLDTVIVGDLTPLAQVEADFALCANFARAAGITTWPCRYGSCVMVLGEGLNDGIWQTFEKKRSSFMEKRYGDQMAIERIRPDATLLQDVLPSGFFLGYRDLPNHADEPPAGCSVVVFAGKQKPDNCDVAWARDAWERR